MKFQFTGGYGRYYPLTGLWANPGDVQDLAEAPDSDWKPLGAAVSAPVAPVAVPVAPSVTEPEIAPQAPAPAVSEADTLQAAEALLEANPELARKLVEDVKNA
jgi:hypothetical protein